MVRISRDAMLFEFINDHQRQAWEVIDQNDITFLIGPAGSAKTFLATAYAIQNLHNKKFKRCHVARPVVQTAGEDLGFLPGTIEQKLDPYLAPIHDCMDVLFEPEQQAHLKERILEKVKVAPIAFCRGRTFSDSICILDEAQNATLKQLKAWMTRLVLGSKMIITGDPTQTDIPAYLSKLVEVAKLCKGTKGIATMRMPISSIVRHEVVKRLVPIFDAMERTEATMPREMSRD